MLAGGEDIQADLFDFLRDGYRRTDPISFHRCNAGCRVRCDVSSELHARHRISFPHFSTRHGTGRDYPAHRFRTSFASGTFRAMSSLWPALDLSAWSATCDTLHAHTQILG